MGISNSHFNPSILSVPSVPVVHQLTTDDLKQLAVETAKAHGLNVSHFLAVINMESGWNIYATGDYPDGKGNFVTEANAPLGSKPTSFGLSQLHYPSRDWGISTSTAYDPKASLEIMATSWENGEAYRWSAWNYYQKYGWPDASSTL